MSAHEPRPPALQLVLSPLRTAPVIWHDPRRGGFVRGWHLARGGPAARVEIMLPLLDIIDDLERTLQWTADGDQALVGNVQTIHQELLALLAAQGVRPFDSVGEPFTPHLHEAVAVAERAEIESGTVVDDLRRGYFLRDELLRPAQVRVAQ